MRKDQCFKDLCGRVFACQEKYGIIEPEADHFLVALIENEDIGNRLTAGRVNMVALKTMMQSIIIMQPNTHQGTVAQYKRGVFYQAPAPNFGTLSAIFKDTDLDGSKKKTRKAVFNSFMLDPASAKVTSLVQEALDTMEASGLEMNDLNLLKTLLNAPDFMETCYSSYYFMSTCGVTVEKLETEYKNPYVDIGGNPIPNPS